MDRRCASSQRSRAAACGSSAAGSSSNGERQASRTIDGCWRLLCCCAFSPGIQLADQPVAPSSGSIIRPRTDIAIPTDQASIARGKHLVEAVAVCTICHGVNLGGKLAFQDAFLGRGYTSNLTLGAAAWADAYTNADWIRSIRYGVRPDGHGIPFMPSDYFNRISDADTRCHHRLSEEPSAGG